MTNWQPKHLAKRLLFKIPVSAWSRLYPRNFTCFLYHTVSGGVLPHIAPLYDYKSPSQFENDLAWIAKKYRIVDYHALSAGRLHRPSRQLAVITFDDGLSECYGVACALLKKYGATATFFIPTGYLDNKQICYRHQVGLCLTRLSSLSRESQGDLVTDFNHRFRETLGDIDHLREYLLDLGWEDRPLLDEICEFLGVDYRSFLRVKQPYMTTSQIKEMAGWGFSFGAHTVLHRPLAKLSRQEAEEEIVESCRVIAKMTGQESVPFAVPFGTDGLNLDDLLQIAARAPEVGQIFGPSGIAIHPQIVSRVSADAPLGIRPGTSNLSLLLRQTYIRHSADLLRLRFRSSGSSQKYSGSQQR